MSVVRGDTDSSDDSLSDEESWCLHFDMPDNDQTWLSCPVGVDPMSVVDLSEIWAASQQIGRKARPAFLDRSSNLGEKGDAFDSRTYTRPKKQNPNIANPALALQTIQSPKLTQNNSSVHQNTSKTECEVLKSEITFNISLNDNRNLTHKILKNANDTFTCKDDFNKNNLLEISDQTLIENTSCPSGLFLNLTNSEGESFVSKNELVSSCEATNETSINSGQSHLKQLKYCSLKKRNVKTESVLAEKNNSSPKYLTEKNSSTSGFHFRPALVSTPKHLERNNIKDPICQSTTQIITKECRIIDKSFKTRNINNNMSFRASGNPNDNHIPCLNETITVDNDVLSNLDKENANYFLEKDSGPYKATSVENFNKTMRITKEKDDDSAPDSCYSSSSNIRSLGDVCVIGQQHEGINNPSNLRKSVSHDSLLSQECYKASSSQFKKHESELNLVKRIPHKKDPQTIEKVVPNTKLSGGTNKIIRGEQMRHLKPKMLHKSIEFDNSLYLQKPKISVSCRDFEKKKIETYRVDESCEGPVEVSEIKPTKALSKIPILRMKSTKIPSYAKKSFNPQ